MVYFTQEPKPLWPPWAERDRTLNRRPSTARCQLCRILTVTIRHFKRRMPAGLILFLTFSVQWRPAAVWATSIRCIRRPINLGNTLIREFRRCQCRIILWVRWRRQAGKILSKVYWRNQDHHQERSSSRNHPYANTLCTVSAKMKKKVGRVCRIKLDFNPNPNAFWI